MKIMRSIPNSGDSGGGNQASRLEGLDASLARRWHEAEAAFADAFAASGETDAAAALMAGRCRANQACEPPDDRDGVSCATEK